jgi:2-amino-4-hydroxy-6-hydroxymethyldihydropteridine diphosphokinase
LETQGLILEACSPVFHTPALGPGGRHYANMAALIATPISPPALLRLLKRTEQDFGRRRGRRWGARVLDLDILIWSGGDWHDPRLHVPHRAMADRRFVLDPLVRIAPDWRVKGALTVRHLRHRLTRTAPVHRGGRTVGL